MDANVNITVMTLWYVHAIIRHRPLHAALRQWASPSVAVINHLYKQKYRIMDEFALILLYIETFHTKSVSC